MWGQHERGRHRREGNDDGKKYVVRASLRWGGLREEVPRRVELGLKLLLELCLRSIAAVDRPAKAFVLQQTQNGMFVTFDRFETSIPRHARYYQQPAGRPHGGLALSFRTHQMNDAVLRVHHVLLQHDRKQKRSVERFLSVSGGTTEPNGNLHLPSTCSQVTPLPAHIHRRVSKERVSVTTTDNAVKS